MSPLESITIPTEGEAPGYYTHYEAVLWHQVDTVGIETEITTWGVYTKELAMFADPFAEEPII